MSTEARKCQALTRAGKPCKLPAQTGQDYCHIHQGQASPKRPAVDPQFRAVIAELNDLADELQRVVDDYSPPPFTPQGLIALLKQNLHRFSPEARLEIVRELQDNLEGASPRDLLDADTWKGVWTLLNHSVQNQTETMRATMAERLRQLPGGEALADFQGMLEGATPRDFLEPETWKGMWFLLNYSLQNQAREARRRLLGAEDAADE